MNINRRIEEMSLHHWPALSTVHYDGWMLRVAGGYSKRANSVVALYESTLDLDLKIKHCEDFYIAHQLRPVFKVTPFAQPENLDITLEKLSYERIDETSVQTMSLDQIGVPSMQGVAIEERINPGWIESFCRLSGVENKHKSTINRMLSSLMQRACYTRIYLEGTVIACGYGVLEEEYIGLYDVVVDSSQRGKGYGEQLIFNLLRWGMERGARFAYLAVVVDNTPAQRLYGKLGFREKYRYWYRAMLD